MKTRDVVAWTLPLLALVSCGDLEAFRSATGADTGAAYREYLESYPQGKHVDAAYARVEAIDYDRAVGENTIEALDRYLEEYPNGRHAREAAGRRRRLHEEAAEGLQARGGRP